MLTYSTVSMIGHENVKHHFLAIKERVGIAKRWNEDIKTLKLDLVLHGRDGTGKSHSFLHQLVTIFVYSLLLYSFIRPHAPVLKIVHSI